MVTWAILSASPEAAEFLVHSDAPLDVDVRYDSACSIEIRGEIVSGDAEKLAAFVASTEHYFTDFSQGAPKYADYEGDGYNLCVSGPGGSYTEALALISLITENAMLTIVPEGRTCQSACALVFMAGIYADEQASPARILKSGASLGFHAPSIDLVGSGDMPVEMVSAAYGAALADIYGILATLLVPTRQGSTARMGASLLAEMVRTPSTEMYMLATVDQVGRWNIDYDDGDGDEDSVRNSEANLTQACVNYSNWLDDRPSVGTSNYLADKLVAIERVHREDAQEGEVTVKYRVDDSMMSKECTFFLPAAADKLRDYVARVEVFSWYSMRTMTYPIPTWGYLRPETTLAAAATRGEAK